MMFDEGLRQRLEALNRGPLPAVAIAPSARRAGADPGLPARPAAASPLRPGTVKPIPGLLRRGDVVTNEIGEHLRIRLPLDDLWSGGEALCRKRHAHLAAAKLAPLSLASRASAEDAAGTGPPSCSAAQTSTQSGNSHMPSAFLLAFPDRLLLIDLETCGLAGSSLFLVGLLRQIDKRLAVELLLARDYSEERAVLASLWQRVEASTVVITFNGKSFDWPMVVDRSRRHLLFRGSQPPAPQHFDVLHAARRRWRGALPNCQLKTLERHICGRTRADDIPGHLIPAAYQQYVRTGCEREMDAILLHNAVDLVTTLDLAMRLAG